MFAGRRYTLLLAAVAALGAGFVLLRAAAYGAGLYYDSMFYMTFNESLIARSGHPPLYSALLAVASLFSGLDPHAAAGPLNALLFGLTIFVAGYWLRRRIASRLLALWGCLAVAFALPLTRVMSWLLSESAFILFVTLTLFYIDRYLCEDKRAALIWAALFTALACLTRPIGLILVIILLPLLLLQPGAPPLEKVKRGAVFALIALMPVSLWLLRNLLLAGFPFGIANPPWGNSTLHRNLNVLLIELAEWILPNPPADEGQWYAVSLGATALGAAGLFALAAAVAFAFIRTYRKPELWRRWSSFCLHGGFALVYLISIIIVSKLWHLDIGWTNRRFWAPAYIPLLFALVFLLDRLLLWLRSRPWTESAVIRTFARVGPAVLGILLFIWIGYNVELNRLAVIRDNDVGAKHLDKGYAAPAWRDNDVIHFIREAQLEGAIIANRHVNVYFHTDPAKIHAVHPLARRMDKLKQKIEQVAAVDDVYLVVFNDTIPMTPLPPRDFGLAELEAMPALERLAQLDSGVIFRVNQDQAAGD